MAPVDGPRDSGNPDTSFGTSPASAETTPPPEAEDGEGLIGVVIEGRYKVQARIGSGGMGVVYRVEHTRLGKLAALKVLRRELAHDGAAQKRFEREAEAVSRLDHPNIVQTFDFGLWQGRPYLVMEYVQGEDLGHLVKRDGPLPPVRALPLFIEVCIALDEAHAQGIVHRDLKPDNIVRVKRRTEGEHAKVLDFGLAKLREQKNLSDISLTGSLVGTPYYMSPEQVRAEPVDARTDIYSLGATMYRILTGTPPFNAETPIGVLSRHVTDEVQPPSARRPDLDLPLEVDHLVLKSMAKRPADRYQSATDLREDLERALERVRTATSADALPAWVTNPMTSASMAAVSGASSATLDVSQSPSASSRTTAPEIPADSDSAGGSHRLRREDVDDFESAMKRRRRIFVFAVPALALAAAAGGWTVLRRLGPGAEHSEVEPNDSPQSANTLPSTPPVFGEIGAPHADGDPDVDWYRIPAAQGARTVAAGVSAIPGLNLVLELFDNDGALVMRADGSAEGGSEQLGPVAIGRGEYFLRVRPLWVQGLPTPGGGNTPYNLDVTVGPRRVDWELEPNEDEAHATPLAAPGEINGTVSSGEDVDLYVIRGPAGAQATATLSCDNCPPAGLEQPGNKTKRPAGDPAKVLPGVLGPDGTLIVAVRGMPGPPGAAPPNRQEPYRLRVDIKP